MVGTLKSLRTEYPHCYEKVQRGKTLPGEEGRPSAQSQVKGETCKENLASYCY